MRTKIMTFALTLLLSGLCIGNPLPTPFIWEFSTDPPWIEVTCWPAGELDGDTIRTTTCEAVILSSVPNENGIVLLDSSNTTGFVLNPEGDSIIFSTYGYWYTTIGYGIYGNFSGSPPSEISMLGKIYPIGFPDPYYELTYEFCMNPSPGESDWNIETDAMWGGSDLIINEISFHGTWRSNSGFVELYNAGTEPFDASDMLLIGNSICPLPQDLLVLPEQYFIIDEDSFPTGFEPFLTSDVLYLVHRSPGYDDDSCYAVVDQVGWSTDPGENISFMRYPDGDVNWSNWDDFRGYTTETSYTFENGFPTRGAANRHECPGFLVIGARADSVDEGSALIHWTDPTWDVQFDHSALVRSLAGYPATPDDGEVIYQGTDQEYTDMSIPPDSPVYYTVFAYNSGGDYSIPTAESQDYIWFNSMAIDEPNIPERISYLSCYPNPFNAQTTISFSLTQPGDTKISIYDLTGRLVETITDGYHAAGKYSITWDAGGYSSGVYFAKLDAGGITESRRILLLK